MKLIIRRLRHPQGMADCEGCNKLRTDATRERARQHAKMTGHTVVYIVEDITTYKPDPSWKKGT